MVYVARVQDRIFVENRGWMPAGFPKHFQASNSSKAEAEIAIINQSKKSGLAHPICQFVLPVEYQPIA